MSVRGSGFLRGDGIADTVYERDEEREVYGARDAGAIAEVQRCEVVDGRFEVCGREPLAEEGLG